MGIRDEINLCNIEATCWYECPTPWQCCPCSRPQCMSHLDGNPHDSHTWRIQNSTVTTHCRAVFQSFLMEWNSLEHLDCSWNLMLLHKDLFYSKWTELHFPIFPCTTKQWWSHCNHSVSISQHSAAANISPGENCAWWFPQSCCIRGQIFKRNTRSSSNILAATF